MGRKRICPLLFMIISSWGMNLYTTVFLIIHDFVLFFLFFLVSDIYYFCCIGHYIPQLAIALLDHNEHSSDFKFNLKGVAVRQPNMFIECINFYS